MSQLLSWGYLTTAIAPQVEPAVKNQAAKSKDESELEKGASDEELSNGEPGDGRMSKLRLRIGRALK